MTVPGWVWAASAAALIAVVTAEVVLTERSGHGSFTARQAVRWTAAYVSLAVIFGLGVGIANSWLAAGQFYAGYLTEYSLSLDNLFIFYVIMSWCAVSPAVERRVLLWGIGLALVLRWVLIVAGAAALSRFGWLFYPLGGVLLWTAIGLITTRPGHQPLEQHTRPMSWLRRHVHPAGAESGRPLITWRSGRLLVAPVLVLAGAIGVADVLFAFDSIPAAFGITTSAYLIVASNTFALMGLRQVYVLLARVLDRIVYLNKGLAAVCAFIGVKLVLQGLRGSGAGWAVDIPAWLSVTIVAAVLLATVLAGLMGSRRRHSLTLTERTMVARRFAVFDIDGNGIWQRADYEQLTRRLCGTFGHAADSAAGRAVAAGLRGLFDALLRHMDTNGDQEITQDEFAAAITRPVADRPGFDAAVRTAAATLIQVADRDGNGVLDPREYAELTAACGAGPDDAARAFGRLDLDHNGVLDAAELTLAIGHFFASPGADHYGNVAFGHI